MSKQPGLGASSSVECIPDETTTVIAQTSNPESDTETVVDAWDHLLSRLEANCASLDITIADDIDPILPSSMRPIDPVKYVATDSSSMNSSVFTDSSGLQDVYYGQQTSSPIGQPVEGKPQPCAVNPWQASRRDSYPTKFVTVPAKLGTLSSPATPRSLVSSPGVGGTDLWTLGSATDDLMPLATPPSQQQQQSFTFRNPDIIHGQPLLTQREPPWSPIRPSHSSNSSYTDPLTRDFQTQPLLDKLDCLPQEPVVPMKTKSVRWAPWMTNSERPTTGPITSSLKDPIRVSIPLQTRLPVETSNPFPLTNTPTTTVLDRIPIVPQTDSGDQWSIHSQANLLLASSPINEKHLLTPTGSLVRSATRSTPTQSLPTNQISPMEFPSTPCPKPRSRKRLNRAKSLPSNQRGVKEDMDHGSIIPRDCIPSPSGRQRKAGKLSRQQPIASQSPAIAGQLQRDQIVDLMRFQEGDLLVSAIESLCTSIESTNQHMEQELMHRSATPQVRLRAKRPQGDSTDVTDSPSMLWSAGATRLQASQGNRNSRTRSHRYEHSRRSGIRRPDDGGQNRVDKVAVEVRVVFLKIGEIDTLKELYFADAFIQAKWREPQLDGRTTEELTITELEQYWNPLLLIDNILTETKETQWLMAQRNDAGEVFLIERRRIKGVFLETLELNDFPLDVQDLTITVTTERPDTEVDIIPDQNEMSAINIQTFVDQQEWKLHEHVEITKRIIKQEYSSSMKSHACLSVTCRAARRPGYFYWNVFLIMFMISSLSFATFAVSPEKAELRLRLSFTLILTSVTFKYVITQSLPKIPYLTYMDKYVLMSLAILCIVSVWHAVITLLDPVDMNVTSSSSCNSLDDLGFERPNLVFPFGNISNGIDGTMSGNSSNQTGPLGQSLPLSLLKSVRASLISNQSNSSISSTAAAATAAMVAGETVNLTGTGQSNFTSTDNQTDEQACSLKTVLNCDEWRRLKVVEMHVFTSFIIIYVIAHAVFIFWLYFDASRRRREMLQKDKEYRVSSCEIEGVH